MNELKKYIKEILGVDVHIESMARGISGKLPIYITQAYNFYEITLFNQELVLVEHKQNVDFSILQTEKQLSLVKNLLNRKVILYMNEITSFNRKRLVEKGVNFIVPGKQFFLPELLIDLRETFIPDKSKKKNQSLLPSAQLITLWYILHRNETIEKYSFKQLAQKFNYTQMAITKVIDDLEFHELIVVEGTKEKFISFKQDRKNLWQALEQRELLTTPVLREIYIDEKPDILLPHSNESALAEYTDMNPSKQIYYAIERNTFNELEKQKSFINPNQHEGKYCLEVWKYNPKIISEGLDYNKSIVDPLSLYLSLRNNKDERIEMALEKLINNFVW